MKNLRVKVLKEWVKLEVFLFLWYNRGQFEGGTIYMNVITLSKKKFATLEPLVLSKDVISTEAEIYQFTHKREEKVLKRLFHQEGNVFANKLYTLEMLDTNKDYLPDNFCIPDSLISVSGVIEGFTLPKIEGSPLVTLLYDDSLDYKEQLYYLKEVGQILDQMKAIRKYTQLKDIYLNDLHDSNFIANTNNKQLTVIDLDSCKIGKNESAQARFLTPYSLLNNATGKYKIVEDFDNMGYVIADEQSDLYCYTIMVLNYLSHSNVDDMDLLEFYNYLNYLEYIGINKELVDSFSRIVINKPNENVGKYLDSLTRENILRARNSVYETVKKVKKR